MLPTVRVHAQDAGRPGMRVQPQTRCASTVKDLVAGAGITVIERGSRTLKGVPGKWRLFAVDSVRP